MIAQNYTGEITYLCTWMWLTVTENWKVAAISWLALTVNDQGGIILQDHKRARLSSPNCHAFLISCQIYFLPYFRSCQKFGQYDVIYFWAGILCILTSHNFSSDTLLIVNRCYWSVRVTRTIKKQTTVKQDLIFPRYCHGYIQGVIRFYLYQQKESLSIDHLRGCYV